VPNYGFVIDLKKCIGCHACTIACKAEHDIPVGVNRCWVKTVEKGTFPDTQRLFLPVLCNQCEEAPCMNICPTSALYKRPDGIVDLYGEICIGCRACMAACPYDQLFIDPNTRTAEKCNFCANRVENELQPACVSVCPTECRIFGDLDDPKSEVSRIVQREAFMVRKPEKGTGPKVFYLGADEATLRPGDPHVDYDVPHHKAWGMDLVMYLLTKGISTGAMLISSALWIAGDHSALVAFAGPFIAFLFSILTAFVLILDLERPERFLLILRRPNWKSWMARGAFLLMAHGALATFWLVSYAVGLSGLIDWIALVAFPVALAATGYTGLLFAQGLARDLWQGPHATVDLVAQALAEGAAVMLLAAVAFPNDTSSVRLLALTLAWSGFVHLGLLMVENLFTPSPTVHHELAVQTIRYGIFKRKFWYGALGLGGVAPFVGVWLASLFGFSLILLVPVALVAIAGGLMWEYIWVEAGQAVPNS
jgi:Fe-S-cluster-containing dehydrogenase component/formate-dependent nitrite reductase membrane component NrfD